MSHRLATFCAVTEDSTADAAPERWRLERAGIINVYQYGNEVLDFGGGRLLLRGVNGSGKSTAMNMLLPFLLTARQRDIDAAQDQRGPLRSWMLEGRDDPQPVGYLWIEYRRGGEFFACGCGIRANRQADNVTTWWFATSQRPGIDIDLVTDGVALSADALRDRLGGDPVFRERDRRDYRRLIEQRLFGGAGLDQHIRLIDKVRNPRVGDRIDRDLPDDLMDALPQLSDRALTDAAAPLDDLDEHRRNVAALERTVSTLGSLLERYRAYCAADLRVRVADARRLLAEHQRSRRAAAKLHTQAGDTDAEVQRIDEEIAESESRVRRLRSEVSAVEESRAYQDGRQLDALRDLVERLVRQANDAQRRLGRADEVIVGATSELDAAQRRSHDDLGHLNEGLSHAAQIAERCGLAERPPPALGLRRSAIDGVDAVAPEPFDATDARRRLEGVEAAARQRRGDIGAVSAAQDRRDEAEARLDSARSALESAAEAHEQAAERCALLEASRADAMREWTARIEQWNDDSARLCDDAASPTAVADDAATAASAPQTRSDLQTRLTGSIEAAIATQSDRAAASAHLRSEARAAVEEQQAVLDELMGRAEPQPPRLGWQSPAVYCLADVVDFAAEVESADRVGLEAAMEASGLLSARPASADTLELATGELIVVDAEPAEHPLSRMLAVTVPSRLGGEVDERLIARLLASVNCERANGSGRQPDRAGNRGTDARTAVAAVSTDGSFRLGTLAGRHHKERAEHIGAAARLEALDRARELARGELERRAAETARLDELHADQRRLLIALQEHRNAFPSSTALDRAESAVETAAAELAHAETRRQAAADQAGQAEQAALGTEEELYRIAAAHALPRNRSSLREVTVRLAELDRYCAECASHLTTLRRSVSEWDRLADRLRLALAERDEAARALASATADRDEQQARLDMLTETVGAEYERVRAQRDRLKAELDDMDSDLPRLRERRDAAVGEQARLRAEADAAARAAGAAEAQCDAYRTEFEDVLGTRGYLDAVADGDEVEMPAAGAVGHTGLAAVADGAERLVGAGVEAGSPPETVSADGVRQSLRRQRDALGGGWDAYDFQPDPTRPLRIEVSGPLAASSTLAEARHGAAAQLRQTAGLLDRKQTDALRQLLQGLIATEIAQKMHGAKRLIDLMNQRLSSVATAHRVGVRLRWRRSPELDQSTSRMVELLAKQPDLRTPDENDAVRAALSERLEEARADEPDASYRQLIAQTLDYKQWHDLDVMVTRPEAAEARLTKRTPLSEGEKKLVTYLPLFVAVAASCDAMAESQAGSHGDQPGIARFVLLDDAFAKVSADNHAALFGLLVALDLDFIATSERLWGDHATLPELSIVEIVRDPTLRTILLDRYIWQGHATEQVAAA